MLNLNDISRQIKSVAYALDKVEVRGHENLDIVLGSIQQLNRTAAQLDQGMREFDPPVGKEPEVKLEIVPSAEEEAPAE